MTGYDLLRDVVDRAGRRAPPDIWVIGSGIRVPGHLTREAVEALRSCRVIYTTWRLTLVGWLLRDLAPRIESIIDLYQVGRPRRQIYDQMVATVLDAADRERPLGFFTDGNPIIFDQVSGGILARGAERGLDVRILPAVSSIDTALVDLKYDIGNTGLQIFEATWMVMREVGPRVDVPCLVLGINAFGTAFATIHHELRPRALAPLRDHLLHFYSPEHEVAFLASATWWHEEPRISRLPLRELADESAGDGLGPTLFIPPLRAPPPGNPAFAARLSDRAHFDETYRPLD